MSNFQTLQLLREVARLYQHERESFSKLEITKKINEIKYLAAQKNVPKLTLRKQIIHLESTLKRILDYEKEISKQKKKESAMISALKRKNKVLLKRLAATEDKDLHKKVNKLSHLLGDNLAKNESAKEVNAASNMQRRVTSRNEPNIVEIESKITHLKAIMSADEVKDPVRVKALEDKLRLIEARLQSYRTQRQPEQREVRHKMVFNAPLPKSTIQELERQLPLPPPPRVS